MGRFPWRSEKPAHQPPFQIWTDFSMAVSPTSSFLSSFLCFFHFPLCLVSLVYLYFTSVNCTINGFDLTYSDPFTISVLCFAAFSSCSPRKSEWRRLWNSVALAACWSITGYASEAVTDLGADQAICAHCDRSYVKKSSLILAFNSVSLKVTT